MKVNVYTREKVNGKRKPYKKINRKRIYSEDTTFTLGYTDPSTRKWKWETLPPPQRPTANSMNLALAAALEKEASFLTAAPSPVKVTPARLRIDEMIETWLDRIYKTRALSTYNAYRVAVENFRKTCSKEFLDELVLRDLEVFQETMLDEEFGDETIKGRLTNLCVFLHAHAIKLTLSHEAAKKDVEAYTTEQYDALCAASTDEEKQLWEFLKKTGFRKGENAHACYTDLRLNDGAIRVGAKPQFGWKPKSKKGSRIVPIPDDLIEMLRARQAAHPGDKLIFPDQDGQPSGSRFLRVLKIRAWKAGLNCGDCIGRVEGKDVSCADGPVCSYWKIHRFRASFATAHYRANVPVQDIMEWLGHTKMDITMRYLASAKIGGMQTRAAVNRTWGRATAAVGV
jgi:integrase